MMIQKSVHALVTDIEGTTTPITFVKDVLFPYARQRMADFISTYGTRPEVRAILDEVAKIEGKTLNDAEAADILCAWIDADRKITPLKAIQGMIWEDGFRQQVFAAPMYDDVGDALRRWHHAGIKLYIYSSGSIMAQKLLFGHSSAGNLNPLFSDYFDTTIGSKLDASSYQTIAKAMAIPAENILFLSDHTGELDAAQKAGWQTMWLNRDNATATTRHHEARDFTNILLAEAA